MRDVTLTVVGRGKYWGTLFVVGYAIIHLDLFGGRREGEGGREGGGRGGREGEEGRERSW